MRAFASRCMIGLAGLLACGDAGRITDSESMDEPPVPLIDRVDPPVFEIGKTEEFTVAGRNFRPNAVLRWNGMDLPATRLGDVFTARAPQPGVEPGDVILTVFNPGSSQAGGGTSSPGTTLPVAYARPFVGALQPRYIERTARDTTVLARGHGFTPRTTVHIADTPAAVELIARDSLRIQVRGNLLVRPGHVDLVLQNPGTTSVVSRIQVYAPVDVEVHGGGRLAGRCVIDAHGALHCWRPVPVPLAEQLRFDAIHATSSRQGPNTCARAVDGQTYCWGSNSSGQLGTGSLEPSLQSTEPGAPVAGAHRFQQLAVGVVHTCGIDAEGRAWCWGSNFNHALGTDMPLQTCPHSATGTCTAVPVPVAGDARFISIAAGSTHTCAVSNDHTAYCWGRSVTGALGMGDVTFAARPEAVATDVKFTSVSAAASGTCALTSSGEAWCWGTNLDGQLGVGDLGSRSTPTRVAGDVRFATLSVGERHSCGVTAGGEAYCWGSGAWGRLGIGETHGHRLSPVRVHGDHLWTDVQVTGDSTCGLAEPGGLYCWGLNENAFVAHEAPIFCNRPPHEPCFVTPVRLLGSRRP